MALKSREKGGVEVMEDFHLFYIVLLKHVKTGTMVCLFSIVFFVVVCFVILKLLTGMLARSEAYELLTTRLRKFCVILWHGRREGEDVKTMNVNHCLNILRLGDLLGLCFLWKCSVGFTSLFVILCFLHDGASFNHRFDVRVVSTYFFCRFTAKQCWFFGRRF